MSEYKCDKCDKFFIFKSDFIRHSIRKKPCNDDTYVCDKCNKKFKYKSKYELHINKKKSCISVEDEYKNKNNNILIKQNDIDEFKNNKLSKLIKIDEIKCIECNKIFASEKSLKRHILNYCKSYEIINKSDFY
jgi:uncharacterized C2H2 Zn-finger protein